MGKESLRGAYDEKFDIEKEYSERVNEGRVNVLIFYIKLTMYLYMALFLVLTANVITSGKNDGTIILTAMYVLAMWL